MMALRVIPSSRVSVPPRVILREPERSDRRPKDRFRATAVKALDGQRSFRRFATQDDRPGRNDRRGQDDGLRR